MVLRVNSLVLLERFTSVIIHGRFLLHLISIIKNEEVSYSFSLAYFYIQMVSTSHNVENIGRKKIDY